MELPSNKQEQNNYVQSDNSFNVWKLSLTTIRGDYPEGTSRTELLSASFEFVSFPLDGK